MSRAINPRALDLNASFLLAHEVVPVAISEARLTLGMRDPDNAIAISAVRFVTGLEVDPVVISESDWSGWRDSLMRLGGHVVDRPANMDNQSPSASSLTILLSEHDVHVQLGTMPELTFAAADDAAWSDLARCAGCPTSAVIVLLDDVVWPIELVELPVDTRSMRRALDAHAPLRADDLSWSLPTAVIGKGTVALSVVRKTWLGERIASINSALSPVSMIVIDEVGRRFSIRPLRARLHWTTAVATAGCVGVMAMALIAGAIEVRDRARVPVLQGAVRNPSRRTAVAEVIQPPGAIATPMAGSRPVEQDQHEQFELVGVVGRLPHDAVALVRPAWGKTVILRQGDSLLGWRLMTITADRVTLAKGAARREIVLAPVAATAQSM